MAHMEEDEGRAAARKMVETEMAKKGISRTELAKLTDLDPKTVRAFLDGTRWPLLASLRKISSALGWLPDEIEHMVESGEHRGTATYKAMSGEEYQKILSMPIESIRTTDLFLHALTFPAHVTKAHPELAEQAEAVIAELTALWSLARRAGGMPVSATSNVLPPASVDETRE